MPELVMSDRGLSSGREGAAALRDAFGEFLDAMVEAGGEAYRFENLLEPPLPEDEVRRLLAERSIDAPEELVTYWLLQGGHRRGSTAEPPIWIWEPGTLERALGTWGRRRAHWDAASPEARLHDEVIQWCNPAWVDITWDHPLVAFTGGPRDTGCAVRVIDPEMVEFGEETVAHQLASICVIFDLLAEAIRRGVLVPTAVNGIFTWAATLEGKEWMEFTRGVLIL